jgi:hypothetical protein
MFGEEYKLWSSSLCNLLHSPVTSSLFGPNILLSIWCLRLDFYFCQIVAGLLMWGALFDERMGLSFTVAAGPCPCSHSRVRVSWDSWPYFTVSGSRLPPTWRARSRIYIPLEQGAPVIPPRHWVTPSLNSIKWLVFVPEMKCVLCEVRTEFLYIIYK